MYEKVKAVIAGLKGMAALTPPEVRGMFLDMAQEVDRLRAEIEILKKERND